jgi:hypothetical protein
MYSTVLVLVVRDVFDIAFVRRPNLEKDRTTLQSCDVRYAKVAPRHL